MLPTTLHITNAWHPTSGGISTFYRALLRCANEHGRPFRLVVPGERTSMEPAGPHGRIYQIRAAPSKIGDPLYRVLWPWGQTGLEIRDILRDEQPDLVEISDKYTLPVIGGLLRMSWIPGVQRRPVVVGTSHERMHDNVAAYLRLGPFGPVLSRIFLKRYYWLMFDHHVANSAFTAEELLPASIGHRVERWLHVLPMGVDCDGFDPSNRTDEAREALTRKVGLPPSNRLLIYAGRLAKEKNLPLLVQMMERLPEEYHLVIAGEGSLREWLQTESNQRARNRIHLIGHLKDRSSVAAFHAGADVFVHPNPNEPFGIAPLEAMAAGVPLVAPSQGGVLSYANSENAWLAEPNPAAFARSVEDVFSNREVREARVAAARQTAIWHNWPRVAERYFELYDRILGGGSFRGTDLLPGRVA